jgi:hypothetical protein
MNFLTAKKSLELITVPDIIVKDFEAMVLDTYFEGCWFDLHHLTFPVDMFAVHSLSFEETGLPYRYVDDEEWMEEHSGDVLHEGFYEILQDVSIVLDYHHMFYAWDDKGEGIGEYIFVGDFENMPIKEVW